MLQKDGVQSSGASLWADFWVGPVQVTGDPVQVLAGPHRSSAGPVQVPLGSYMVHGEIDIDLSSFHARYGNLIERISRINIDLTNFHACYRAHGNLI